MLQEKEHDENTDEIMEVPPTPLILTTKIMGKDLQVSADNNPNHECNINIIRGVYNEVV